VHPRSPRNAGHAGPAIALVAAVALVAACSSERSSATDPPPPPTVSLPAPPVVDPVEAPCRAAQPGYASRGTVSVLGVSGPDAHQLSGIDWAITPTCERVVFSFLTDDAAPASTLGLSRLEFFPEQAIIRVTIPRDVSVTGVADVLVEGTLIERAFVVRTRGGDLAVDLHLGSATPIEARGLVLGSPARLAVDVRPGPGDPSFAGSPPSIGAGAVVLSPSSGETDYPLRIRGYARTGDDAVMVTLRSGAEPIERSTTSAPSADAWGEFALTITEGPAGPLTLEIASGADAAAPLLEIALSVP
jgi:hypothetical protein